MTKGKKTIMQKIRESIYRLRLKQSLRQVSKDLHIHRTILRKIQKIAIQQGWLDPVSSLPDDYQIHQIFNENLQSRSSIFDAYYELIKEWRDSGYTAVVIHRLLKEKIDCSIGQLRRYLSKSFPKQIDPIMVRSTNPGETMDVDFCYIGNFWDAKELRFRKTWIFSARLRHSRKAYREAVFDQSVTTFIKCHIHAFEWFGGVPAKVVLDNLKAGVIKSCVDNDQINRSYHQMAEYYQVLIDPCLPYTPEHKGGVENDMRYIKRNFLPLIKERQKYQSHLDLNALQAELEKWDKEIADLRIIYGVGRSPATIFAEDEKKMLRDLPKSRWDIVEWHQCEVRKDWRIMFDNSYYSVPYFLIGQTVQIMSTSSTIRVFFEHNQVAHHLRAQKKWEYQRNPDHAPPFKEAVLCCTREGLLIQSQEIGPWTYALTQKILNDPVVDKLKPVRKLLSLVLSYEKERIESACERALYYNTLRYQSVKHILENGLDQEPIKKQKISKVHPLFKHARDPHEYQIKTKTKEEFYGRDSTHQ